MNMTTRPSTTQDVELLIDIWRRAVDATHDFLTPHDRIAIEADVRASFPQADFIVAVDESDAPIGFMILDGAHMDALFIDPAHHGRGLGRTLVDVARRKHPTVTTEVNEQNTQAVGFYERLGFRRISCSATDGQGRPYPLLHMQS